MSYSVDMIPVAGGDLYEMWGWSCGVRGCRASVRHRAESVVRDFALRHKETDHPEVDGQQSLLDEIVPDDEQRHAV